MDIAYFNLLYFTIYSFISITVWFRREQQLCVFDLGLTIEVLTWFTYFVYDLVSSIVFLWHDLQLEYLIPVPIVIGETDFLDKGITCNWNNR